MVVEPPFDPSGQISDPAVLQRIANTFLARGRTAAAGALGQRVTGHERIASRRRRPTRRRQAHRWPVKFERSLPVDGPGRGPQRAPARSRSRRRGLGRPQLCPAPRGGPGGDGQGVGGHQSVHLARRPTGRAGRSIPPADVPHHGRGRHDRRGAPGRHRPRRPCGLHARVRPSQSVHPRLHPSRPAPSPRSGRYPRGPTIGAAHRHDAAPERGCAGRGRVDGRGPNPASHSTGGGGPRRLLTRSSRSPSC